MPQTSVAEEDIPLLEGPLDDGGIRGSAETSLDKWHVENRTGGASLKTWTAHESVNLVLMSKELESKLEIAKIIPIYAAYMDTERVPPLGLSLGD